MPLTPIAPVTLGVGELEELECLVAVLADEDEDGAFLEGAGVREDAARAKTETRLRRARARRLGIAPVSADDGSAETSEGQR